MRLLNCQTGACLGVWIFLCKRPGRVNVDLNRQIIQWGSHPVNLLADGEPNLEGECAQWNREVSSSSSTATSRVAFEAILVRDNPNYLESPPEVMLRNSSPRDAGFQ